MNASTDPVLFRSPRPYAKLVTAAFLLYAAGVAWFSLAMIRGIGYMRDVQAGRAVDLAAVTDWQAQVDGYHWKLCAVQILGIVMFLMWIHRVAANLRAFGVDGVPARSAVGSFFIPVLNLWKPYLALCEIWMASTPPPTEPTYTPIKASPLLLLWWLTWTVSRVGTNLLGRTTPESDPAALIGSFQTCLGFLALEMLALVLMLAVVWGLTRLQDRRASAGLAEATVISR